MQYIDRRCARHTNLRPTTISLPEGVSEHCFLAEVAFFPRVCGFSVGMLVLPVGVDGYINVPCRRRSSLLVSCGVEIYLAFDRVGLGAGPPGGDGWLVSI